MFQEQEKTGLQNDGEQTSIIMQRRWLDHQEQVASKPVYVLLQSRT
jgi:hypothetical protein